MGHGVGLLPNQNLAQINSCQSLAKGGNDDVGSEARQKKAKEDYWFGDNSYDSRSSCQCDSIVSRE